MYTPLEEVGASLVKKLMPGLYLIKIDSYGMTWAVVFPCQGLQKDY
jgi:hypothetical protein